MSARACVAVVSLLMLSIVVGCDDDATTPDPPPIDAGLVASDLPRDTSPDVPAGDLEQLAAGNHAFALSLFHELDPTENLLISPLSIRTAFSMVYAGARGETAAQMDLALQYGLDQARLHPAWNGRDLILASRNDPGDDRTGPVELHLVNSVFARLGYPFVDDYLDLLAIHYGTGVRELDFYGAPEECRETINTWVADETRQRIRDLLPPLSITGDTAVVLVNALYFYASWENPFDPDSTVVADFHLLDGSTEAVPTLRQTARFGYHEEPGVQVLDMPLSDADMSLSLVVILPDEGQFTSFVDDLDTATLDRLLDGPTVANVDVSLPKFSFESSVRLKTMLQRLGMELPFTAAADFSGMTQNDLLWIDDAYHKTFIGVDEVGVEAAAATAVVMIDSAVPEHHVFTADRPFLVVIRDRETGTILFMGSVVAL